MYNPLNTLDRRTIARAATLLDRLVADRAKEDFTERDIETLDYFRLFADAASAEQLEAEADNRATERASPEDPNSFWDAED